VTDRQTDRRYLSLSALDRTDVIGGSYREQVLREQQFLYVFTTKPQQQHRRQVSV